MIESIEFKNFKALRDTTLPLGRFTLIVGPNGSGKSTAMQALEIAGGRRPFEPHRYITVDQLSIRERDIELSFLINVPERLIVKKFLYEKGRGTYPTYLPDLKDYEKEALENTLKIQIYSFEPQAIAAPVNLMPNDELLPNGGRLAGVLDRLRDQYPERFDAINEALGVWLPEFDQILFETPAQGQRAFLLRTRNGHHKIPAAELSQGTLLALAMLSLAYLPNPPAVIGLEEPDRGIHPRLLRDVQDALYRLAYPENYGENREPVQVIATTHSPYFLDLFRDHPEEVVLANKTDEGTKFERLSDQPNLDEILEDSHLGEVWYTGILGGVPAHA